MKRLIFFVFGSAIGFVLRGFAATSLSGGAATLATGASVLLGGWAGSRLAGRARAEIEKTSTPSWARAIIWFLAIAIITVAVIAFWGLKR